MSLNAASPPSHTRPCRRALGALLCASVLAVAGCGREVVGDGLPREAVSGTVKWKGKSLARGTIQYIPVGPSEIAPIIASVEDGRFLVPKEQGPLPGKYTVAITETVDAPQPESSPGESLPLPSQPIPPKYNVKSKLTADVKAGGPNASDFDLTP